MQFESAVTEMYEEAFVGSAIENGTTMIIFDLRKLNFQQKLGTTSDICWRKDFYHIDIHELSTFHNPIKYRFIVAQGSYLNDQNQRVYFTPEIQGVSTSQHIPTVSLGVTCVVVCTYGYDDGRIGPTRCAVIDAALDGRSRPHQACKTLPAGAGSVE
jgi:hypothetical protein